MQKVTKQQAKNLIMIFETHKSMILLAFEKV